MSKIYDVIVLGAGPSGLTAGLYAGRSRLSTLIIEKGQDGGQIAITNEKEGKIGKLHDYFYTTVGNGTAVASAKAFAAEYAQKLLSAGVDAVIMTST